MTSPSMQELEDFLARVYPKDFSSSSQDHTSAKKRQKPFVTLTYAQSLDGKISGPNRSQLRLSGKESMTLTHKLREMHDSILVGVGTVLTDDPQLTARLPDLLPISSQPQPIILDTKLRIPSTSRFFKNAKEGTNHAPVLVWGGQDDGADARGSEREKEIEDWGGKVEKCSLDREGHVGLESLLRLPAIGKSLMVEGGASVISSFLASNVVDLLVITIAPILVGDGICMVTEGLVPPGLEFVSSKMFGSDVVLVLKPVRK